jgi:hypothetical protein
MDSTTPHTNMHTHEQHTNKVRELPHNTEEASKEPHGNRLTKKDTTIHKKLHTHGPERPQSG